MGNFNDEDDSVLGGALMCAAEGVIFGDNPADVAVSAGLGAAVDLLDIFE